MRASIAVLTLMVLCAAICTAQTYRAAGYEWSQPVKVLVENPGDFARQNEVVILKIKDLGITPASAASAMRLVDPKAKPDEDGESGGNDLPFQIDGEEFSFAVDLAPGEKKELLLFKPQAPGAPAKDYAATSDLKLDADAGTIGNSLVDVAFTTPTSKSLATSISYKSENVVPDVWLYIISGEQKKFRTRGPVTKVELVCNGPVRKRVLIHRQPDLEEVRSAYQFRVSIEVTAKRASALIRMDTIPGNYEALQGFLYATVWKPDPKKDLLYSFRPDGTLESTVPETREAYGRINFDVVPPWLMLFDKERKLGIGVGAPRGDVKEYTFACDLKRYELRRPPALVNPRELLIYCTTFDFGETPNQIALLERARDLPVKVSIDAKKCSAVNPLAVSRALADDPMPAPDMSQAPAKKDLTSGIIETNDSIRAGTSEMALTIDKKTGGIKEIRCGKSTRTLPTPGGFWFVRWPDRRDILVSGQADGWKVEKDAATFSWRGEGIQRTDSLAAKGDCLEWAIEIENTGNETQLLETRFSLPLDAEPGGWFFWDGSFAYRLKAGQPPRGFTTLAPGGRTCQGIFPSAAIWDGEMGIAAGLRPMDIYSFYGAVADPGAGPDRAFNSILRLVIPPREKRQAAFVLYPIDPNWGWRSCLDRYYRLFPDIFAAPTRYDIWGLYGTTGSERIESLGDTFIDICRRYRIGGLELYAPFTKTGEFYPDEEPCYSRLHKDGKILTLNREQMKKGFEICNIATCNLSYVIPTKCERALALEKYQDSIIKEKDGKFFLRDYWCVIGNAPHAKGEERLAGMFAWGDRFGERLKKDIERIVDNYKPEGFYFDNGSFVWEDYGRRLRFSSFDDDGQVYTNAGIAYALIQDDLMAYAPYIHRNPGEFIQYFSGFRGQSHLTNVTTTQTNYIRSHRFIMGNKPIFVGHPRDYQTRADVQKALLVGGLPWMSNTSTNRPHRIELVRGFADVCIALARAGWRPVTGAACDAQGIRIERFGDGLESFLVIVNQNTRDTALTLAANASMMGAEGALVFGDFFERVPLKNRIDPSTGLTELKLSVPAREAVVLRASAMVKGASSPFAMTTRLDGSNMEYAFDSPQKQNISLQVRTMPKRHFADEKAQLDASVSGSKKQTLALAPDVQYHSGEPAVAKFELLAKAEPVRVVIPKGHSLEEMYDARRIRGFHELQTQFWKKEAAQLTIAPGQFDDLKGAVVIGLASQPEIGKVLKDCAIDFAPKDDRSTVAALHGGSALLITSGTERGLRQALWDYLTRIEAPFPNDSMKTQELAVPKTAE